MALPLDQRLGSDVARVYQELMGVKQHAVRPAGLTVAQYKALYILADSPGISGAALARACLITPQTMAATLRLLETAGLVERRPHQWHRNVLETQLTPAGRHALDIADEAASRVERRILERYTDGERDTLRALLRRFSDELAVICAVFNEPSG